MPTEQEIAIKAQLELIIWLKQFNIEFVRAKRRLGKFVGIKILSQDPYAVHIAKRPFIMNIS